MWTLAQLIAPDWMSKVIEHVPILFLRTLITFVIVLAVVRWTGKRSIANLAPFDLAMVIMIGEVAAIPVSDLEVDLLHGMLPVVLIGALHVLTTAVSLRSKWFERMTEGVPTLLVKDGKVIRQNLLRERVSMEDLLTALRHKEIKSLREVKRAWIEHAGGVSVIREERADAVTPDQLDEALERAVDRIVQANAARVREEVEALLRHHGQIPGGH